MSDLDEIRKKLAEAGIPTDAWSRTAGGPRPLPSSVVRQKELLGKLRDLLQVRLDQDRAKLAELHEVASRLKHGGGS